MSVITKVPEPNIYEQICKEFAGHKLFIEDDESSILTDYTDFDPAKHNPVFYGQMHTKVPTDANIEEGVNVAITHPSVIGYAFTEKPAKLSTPPPPPIPQKDQCYPSEYLELYVFPVLLPAIERMLEQAKKEKCFERKRTKFDALDFLTQFLYNNNPNQTERSKRDLEDIPFVKEWLKDQIANSLDPDETPRSVASHLDPNCLQRPSKSGSSAQRSQAPIALSLIWTEEEAAVKIQSFWRGYRVRKEPDIQELRQWQAEWREENGGIQRRVSDFWEKKEKDVGDT